MSEKSPDMAPTAIVEEEENQVATIINLEVFKGGHVSSLDQLPLELLVLIMSLIDATSLKALSKTNKKFNEIADHPAIWEILMARDVHLWNLITHKRNPLALDYIDKKMYHYCQPGTEKFMGKHSTTFLPMFQFFGIKKIPKFAIIGPGVDAGTSILKKLMQPSSVFNVIKPLPSIMNGIGSGIQMETKNHKQFIMNIMLSNTYENRKAAGNDRCKNNRLLQELQENAYTLVPPLPDFLPTLDGIIYCVNGFEDAKKFGGSLKRELDLLMVPFDDAKHFNSPLLVLSVTSDDKKPQQTSCINLVEELGLTSFRHPWQVHSVVTEKIETLLPGIEWMLEMNAANG